MAQEVKCDFDDQNPGPFFCYTLTVLTVLMFTLMTGMRERQDDAGSGLSALIFTLHKEEQRISLTAS